MKGLIAIPSDMDLSRIYDRLQSASEAASCAEIAAWSQLSRFDPRLAEQLISHLALYWRKIAPESLRETLLQQPWPAAMGVLLEHLPLLGSMERKEQNVFSRWKDWVMAEVPPAPNEQFLIGLRAFGGKAMGEDAVFSLSLYRKWGFLGRDVLLNKWRPGRKTLLPSQARKVALDELIRKYPRFTVRDYRAFLRNEVSVRQAELDLNACRRIRAIGTTRGRIYVRRRAGLP